MGNEFRMDAKDIKTGTDAVRAKVWSVWRRGNFAGLARDLQVPIGDLELFAKGEKHRLSDDVMKKLVKTCFHNAEFDPIADLLLDVSPPPKLLGVVPGPYDPASDPNFIPHDAARSPLGVRQEPAKESARPDPFKRPGFAT